jgi:hypothetical protein
MKNRQGEIKIDFADLKENYTAKLSSLIAKKFSMEPYALTQFVRGELVVMVDTILSYPDRMQPAEYAAATEFFETYIRAAVELFRHAQILLPEYIEMKALNPNTFFVHEATAIVSSIQDFCDALNFIFGSTSSRTRFYTANDASPIKQPATYAGKSRDRATSFNQITNLINFFGGLGGFEEILALINWKRNAVEYFVTGKCD